MSMKYQMIYRTNITGLSHHNYALHAKQIEVGDELQMERDQGNRFDDEAVKIMHDGTLGEEQIGWLAAGTDRNKGAKFVIAKLMDAGMELKCIVISHDRSVGALDQRLYVGVYIGYEA